MTADSADIPGYIAGTWDIDPVHSHVGFVARHLMVSKVRGQFATFSGQIVTAEDPLQSSATATIDTTSLQTGNAQRDSDIKAESFLDAENNPAITFQSTSVRAKGESELVLVGDLTIKGVTKPVELDVEINGFGPDPYGGTRAGFSATGEINRNDYGITATMTLPTGGVVIGEKIQLTIEAEATLKKEG